MQGRLLMGIDKGTSVTKAVIFDEDGNEVSMASAPINTLMPQPGRQEEDPEAAWQSVRQVMKEALSRVDAKKVAGIGAAGYMGGAWLIGKDGRETHNGMTWTDARAANLVKQWQGDGTAERFFALGGNAMTAGLTLVITAWLARNQPETLARTKAIFCSKDWVRYKLTGTIATDETDIMWMPGDPRKRTYSEELFALLAISEYRHLFPEPVPSDSLAGELLPELADEMGMNRGTPVVVGMGDACSGHYAVGALEEGQAVTIMGTSLINSLTTSTPVFEPDNIGVQFLLIGNKWIRMLPNTGGGSINLRWFLDTLCEPYKQRARQEGLGVYEVLDRDVAATPIGSNGVIYHPFINPSGVIAPFYNLSAAANFFGLRLHNTHADMVRAVYEGVGLAIYDCYEAIPSPIKAIRLTGGGARSAVWCQIVADCVGKPCEVPRGEEATAQGVALLAGVVAGIYDDYRDAAQRVVRIERTYEPDPASVAKYRELYSVYRKVREGLMDAWHLHDQVYQGLRQG